MKRFIFISILILSLFILAAPSYAQGVASIGTGATTTENANQRGNNVFFGFAGGYWHKSLYVGGEAITNDGNRLRSRFGGYQQVGYNEIKFDLGGGYWRFGAKDGAYAHLGVNYGKAHLFGRLGNERMLEAEGAYDVAQLSDHIGLQAFIRGTRHEATFGRNGTVSLYNLGVRLTFK
jgi:hypothetical protein